MELREKNLDKDEVRNSTLGKIQQNKHPGSSENVHWNG